jgi:ABC-type branched-subunit amino acid transport system ATPase component
MVQGGWERFLRTINDTTERWRATSTANPLEVRDISLAFGGIAALEAVDLDVRPGEIVGLIGPNGAGKTTLINVLSGELEPYRGSVRVGGHDVTDLAPELRSGFGVGRSYQDARLFPGLTVAEAVQVSLSRHRHVGFVSSMLRAPWARDADVDSRREAELIMDTMGLTPWADALTAELSTGMRRITDLAMQIAARPEVLVLDEPTAGVAQREAEQFGPMLRRIRDQLECAILIIEHDMPLLMGLCDRIYAMETGRIIASGTPVEIRSNPKVIASYLGTDQVAIERSGARTASKRRKRQPRAAENAPT